VRLHYTYLFIGFTTHFSGANEKDKGPIKRQPKIIQNAIPIIGSVAKVIEKASNGTETVMAARYLKLSLMICMSNMSSEGGRDGLQIII
jgi:hypothetical protein